MRIRLSPFKLSLFLAAVMAVLGVALVTYANLVVREQALEKASSRLEATAKEQAEVIRKRFDGAMEISRTLAQALGVNLEEGPRLSRAQASAILCRTLESNPDLLGIYSVWEPDAFDGEDAKHRKDPLSDASGRFVPYWTRDPAGNLQVEPIEGYDTPGTGDFYQIPKYIHQELLTEPYHHSLRGQDVFLTSMVAPILTRKGRFQGTVGTNLRITSLQKWADAVDVYHHTGKLYLLTSRGTFAACTGLPNKLGIQGLKPEKRALFDQQATSLQDRIFRSDGNLYAFIPFHVGQGTRPWVVFLEVPEKEVLQEAVLTIRVMTFTGIGILALALLSMVLLWRLSVASRILPPDPVQTADPLAAGESTPNERDGFVSSRESIGRKA